MIIDLNHHDMKAATFLTFSICYLLVITSCTTAETKQDRYFTKLEDGLYYLNGTDENHKVIRQNTTENYILNSTPIFDDKDIESIDIVKEENGKYSLDLTLTSLSESKWDDVLNSKSIYIGIVSQNQLKDLIKIKGENARDAPYLYCISDSRETAEVVRQSFLR